ncbi:MAG: transcriptional regulator, partial [Bacteroidetes bacterium 4484_276]
MPETTKPETVLAHLNLVEDNRINNAAILLFGKNPQRFFITSEIRCASFYGFEVEKPIASYKVFKGDVFELVDQAVEFVLSKLDYRIETRKEHVQIPGSYEIPKGIIAEAIVNAVAHRDYTSNGSVQVMMFRDRVEVWNPGSLPLGWTTEKLKQLHSSMPANPLLAEPMYLTAYIERLGTGTTDMLKFAKRAKLREPVFIQEDSFRTIIYRPHAKQVTGQVSGQVTFEVRKVVLVLSDEMKRTEIQNILQLKHRDYFMENYLNPALKQGFIEMGFPDAQSHPRQKYTLAKKGEIYQKELLNNLIDGDTIHDTTHDT